MTALRRPGAHVLLLGLTLSSARESFWPTLVEMNTYHGLGARCNNTLATWRYPNGSLLRVAGAETRREIEKLRGAKYDLVVVDEAKSFNGGVLEELLDDILGPALSDRRGTLMMVGTPGIVFSGPFFEATYPGYKDDKGRRVSIPHTQRGQKRPKWSFHTWTARDNSANPNIWLSHCETKERNGWSDDHPTWRREYLGEWVLTDDSLVYAYARLLDTGKVSWSPDYSTGHPEGLPKDHEWIYLCGIDPGYSRDPTAIVVAAFSETDHSLWFVHAEKDTHLLPQDVSERLTALERRFGSFAAIVADTGNLGAAYVDQMRRVWGWSIEAADKRDKITYIEMLNGDFESGRIKIRRDSELAHQMLHVQWNTREGQAAELARIGRLKIDRTIPDDLCDAALYLWRHAGHHFATTPTSGPVPGSAAWFDEQNRRALRAKVREIESRASGDPLENDDFTGYMPQDLESSWISPPR